VHNQQFVRLQDNFYRLRKVTQSVAFVRLSVRLFPLYLLKRLNFELEFVCVCGGGHDRSSSVGLKSRYNKVKVKGQCPARMGVVTQ